MNWVILAIISAAFAGAINHTDKFLLGRVSDEELEIGGTGALVIISSSIGFLVAGLIWFFNREVITHESPIPIIINGMIYISWLIPYFIAISKDEASIVAPLFQMTPVVSVFLGFFLLGEVLSGSQVLGACLVLVGAVALTLKFEDGKAPRLKRDIFLLMFIASALVAINGVLFKVFVLDSDFWTISFWEYVGFGLAGILIFTFVKTYRREFLEVVKHNSKLIWSVNFGNEVMAIVAKMLINLASIFGVVAAVFFVAEGFQPFFVLAIGVVLTKLFPQISTENLEIRQMAQKIVSVAVMFFGTSLLYLS